MALSLRADGIDTALKFIDRFPKETEKAQVRALNRGIKAARTAGARAVSKDMGIRVGTARDRLELEQARPGKPEAALKASRKRIPLIDFKGTRGPYPSRGKGRGVRSGLKGGQRQIPDAFITQVGGHRGVFRRRGTARLPIVELKGPSIWLVARKKARQMATVAREATAKELLRLLRRQFGVRRVG